MHQSSNITCGILYIVATPIGNLEDITLRAIRILNEVDIVAAEDTRHTQKLLNHLGIDTKLISYYREKEKERSRVILEHLVSGHDVALVSDAGTPAISDPGSILVDQALDTGIRVVPIPGPSALTAAVSCAGLPDTPFLFLGFAPAKKGQRRKILSSLVSLEFPVVLYESPHRIENLLRDALEILGDRTAFLGREITKTYEEFQRDSLSNLLRVTEGKNRGEFVIIVSPGSTQQAEGENIEELLVWYRDQSSLSLKDTCKKLATDLGLSRSQVYQKALLIWKDAN